MRNYDDGGVEPWQRLMESQSRPHTFGRIVRSPWYPKEADKKEKDND